MEGVDPPLFGALPAQIGASSRQDTPLSPSQDLLSDTEQQTLLEDLFQRYSDQSNPLLPIHMTLTRFRRCCQECRLVDGRKICLGDVDVVYRSAVTGKAKDSSRLMTLPQFKAAVRVLASKVFATNIECMTGKR